VLKQFRRVPLADLEMVLPGASVHLHPNLYITIAATALGGLAAAGVAAWQVGAGCKGGGEARVHSGISNWPVSVPACGGSTR
jgi:hypothetical protein